MYTYVMQVNNLCVEYASKGERWRKTRSKIVIQTLGGKKRYSLEIPELSILTALYPTFITFSHQVNQKIFRPPLPQEQPSLAYTGIRVNKLVLETKQASCGFSKKKAKES